MSNIWTPEELTPKGWDTDEWFGVHSFDPNKEETVVIKGKILKAVYHEDEEQISLVVRVPDGSPKVVPISKSAFTFHGKPHTELPKEETDREMFKTAELFNRRKGASVSLNIFTSQA